MKILAFLVLLSASPALAHDHPAMHGMAVVGEDKIYLSHLPMFHSPHDYQVILEAELDPAARDAYLASKRESAETVYTIAPENFVLPEMVENPRPFRAQLFRGHFERGGTAIANATVTIKRVLLFKKFDPQAIKPEQALFFLFGTASEQFMAHLISAKPDFDQLLRVAAPGGLEGKLTITDHKNEALEGSETFRAQQNGVALSVNVLSSLYYETGDLAE